MLNQQVEIYWRGDGKAEGIQTRRESVITVKFEAVTMQLSRLIQGSLGRKIFPQISQKILFVRRVCFLFRIDRVLTLGLLSVVFHVDFRTNSWPLNNWIYVRLIGKDKEVIKMEWKKSMFFTKKFDINFWFASLRHFLWLFLRRAHEWKYWEH